MALTESLVREKIGIIHTYVQKVCTRYRTTSFTSAADIQLINAQRLEKPISETYEIVGFYSFGKNYDNTLVIFADGRVKEYVMADFPQYITIFVEELCCALQEKLIANVG